jgi:hypothetical protein
VPLSRYAPSESRVSSASQSMGTFLGESGVYVLGDVLELRDLVFEAVDELLSLLVAQSLPVQPIIISYQ